MKALLLRTQRSVSKHGGDFHYAFFRGEDEKSYRSCLYEQCRNFKRWKPFIGRTDVWLDGLEVIENNLINADSYPREIVNENDKPKHAEEQARQVGVRDSQMSWEM